MEGFKASFPVPLVQNKTVSPVESRIQDLRVGVTIFRTKALHYCKTEILHLNMTKSIFEFMLSINLRVKISQIKKIEQSRQSIKEKKFNTSKIMLKARR